MLFGFFSEIQDGGVVRKHQEKVHVPIVFSSVLTYIVAVYLADPYLTSQYSIAFVKGLQEGDDSRYIHVMP